MWTRRTSWLLVSVQLEKDSRRIWVPVPIWVVAELLRGLWVLLLCFPFLCRRIERLAGLDRSGRVPLRELAAACLDVVEGLRRSGPFTLVEFIDGDTAVSIRLV